MAADSSDVWIQDIVPPLEASVKACTRRGQWRRASHGWWLKRCVCSEAADRPCSARLLTPKHRTQTSSAVTSEESAELELYFYLMKKLATFYSSYTEWQPDDDDDLMYMYANFDAGFISLKVNIIIKLYEWVCFMHLTAKSVLFDAFVEGLLGAVERHLVFSTWSFYPSHNHS